MNGLFEAAREMQQFMQARSWSFCFIGGIAVIRWGEVRMTQDVALSLLTGFGHEKPYIRELLNNFQSRIEDFIISMDRKKASLCNLARLIKCCPLTAIPAAV